jgi:hypothetical protein
MKIAPPTEHPVPAWQITPWLQIHGITCHPASRVEFFSSLLEPKGESRRADVIGTAVHVIRARGFSFETSPPISPSPFRIGDHMAKKRKRVAWSAEQVRTLKSMAKKKNSCPENSQEIKAHRGCDTAKSI